MIRRSQLKCTPDTSNSHPRQINPTLLLPPKGDETRKVVSKGSHLRPNDLTRDVDIKECDAPESNRT